MLTANYACENQVGFSDVQDFNKYMESFQTALVIYFTKDQLRAGNVAAAERALKDGRTNELFFMNRSGLKTYDEMNKNRSYDDLPKVIGNLAFKVEREYA